MGALDNLDSTLSGETGGATAYTNQVYLGQQGPKEVRMKRSGKTITVPSGDKTLTIQEAKAKYLTDPNIEKQWLQTLRKNGIDTNAPGFQIKARSLWDLSVDGASDWYATSNGKQKVTPEQYLGWYIGGTKKAPKPDIARSIYAYSPEQIGEDIDKVAQSVLGRTINEEDKVAEWYTDLTKAITKMASKGTTTEVKDIRNPKTGKLERVTTQTPEFTTQKAKEKISTTLREVAPEDVARKERVDFTKWLFSQMGGRG